MGVGVLTFVFLSLLAGCLTSSPQFEFDENNFLFFDETGDSSKWSSYEELVAGKDHTYLDHSYHEEEGIYRFQESTFKPSATVLNLDKMESLEKVHCNSKRDQIKLRFSGEQPEEEGKIREGSVLLFGPRDDESGCPLNRNWYRVEEVVSEEDGSFLLDVSEQDPRKLIDKLAVNFYQEKIRPEGATTSSTSGHHFEEEEVTSDVNFRDSAPSEARDMIETILRLEKLQEHGRKYEKRAFLRLLSGASESIRSKVARAGTRIQSKFQEMKQYFSGPHNVSVPKAVKGEPQSYARDIDVFFSKNFELINDGHRCNTSGLVNLEVGGHFHVNFGFSFLIEQMTLRSANFTLGLKALFSSTLSASAHGRCIKNFATLDIGAEIRIPIPPAPGLTVLVHPYARLEGSVHLNLLVESKMNAKCMMYRYFRKWALETVKKDGNAGETRVFRTYGEKAQWKFLPVAGTTADPQKVNVKMSLSLLLTPVVGLKIGASAMELIDLKAGPVVQVPLRFSLLFDLQVADTNAKLKTGQRCFMGTQFTAGLKLGATLDLRLFGLQAIEGEWMGTIRTSDCDKNKGCDKVLQKSYKNELRKIDGGSSKVEVELKKKIDTLAKELAKLKSLKVTMKEGKQPHNEFLQWGPSGVDLAKILQKENELIEKQNEFDELGDVFKLVKERNDLLKKAKLTEAETRKLEELEELIANRRAEVIKGLSKMYVKDDALFMTTHCWITQDAANLKNFQIIPSTPLFEPTGDQKALFINSESFLKMFWSQAAEDYGQRTFFVIPQGWRTISQTEAKNRIDEKPGELDKFNPKKSDQ